jgi:hypothetical protein
MHILYENIFEYQIVDPCNQSDNDLKTIMMAFDLNSFHIRFQLMHDVKTNDGWKKIPHPTFPSWKSENFTEGT